MAILQKLALYFSYDFVQYAMIVGVLVSVCAAIFGVVLVLRHFAFIGDGLSHIAFGAMTIAAVAGVSDKMIIVMPITILAAVFLLGFGDQSKIKGESSIVMMAAGAMSIGYILLSTFSASSNVAGDVCGALFGSHSILTLKKSDVIICVTMSAIVIALFILMYNRIVALAFDEDFARAAGVKVVINNLLVAMITAVIIVIAKHLVGSLLVSALIVFPALSAMRITRSFKRTVIFAAVLSGACAFTGIILSILLSLPVGPAVVCVDIVGFAACCAVGKLIRR